MKKQTKKMFAAMVPDKDFYWFDIMLVNRTWKSFSEVHTLTGASQSIGDDLLETSKAVQKRGALPKRSFLRVGGTDIDELEMMVCYDLDLFDKSGALAVQYSLVTPSGWGVDRDRLETLPMIGEGIPLELKPRHGEPVFEWAAHNDMGPKYTACQCSECKG